MKTKYYGSKITQKHNMLRKYALIILIATMCLPLGLFAQEKVSQEEIDKHNEVKKAAKEENTAAQVEKDGTGNDPRAMTSKWTPFYRYQEFENGLVQQDMTAFGSLAFNDYLMVMYEVPLAQYRDFSGMPGLPADVPSSAIGVGDVSLKFFGRPKSLDFSWGTPSKMNKKSGSLILGTDLVLPTATSPYLAGNSFKVSPIVGVVVDTPMYGFFAMLNLYYFDVYKTDAAPKTSMYVGRWFYMQPITPPGKWWGLFFLMPEFQPIYNFETKDFSAWIGVELGKIIVDGQVAYIKPGWGISNSEQSDRVTSFEFGWRYFL